MEKDKNHKAGQTDLGNSGLIPFLDINKFYNPGKLFETYLKYIPRDPDFPLFPMPKQNTKHFDLLDPSAEVLFLENKKVGRNTIKQMLPNLCDAAGVAKCTNHQGKTNTLLFQIKTVFIKKIQKN